MSSAEVFEELAIFPLPRVQLFPHAVLPLHVFEPRYRALLADCLAGDKIFAIATLLPGYEADYERRPPVRPVCGVGQVIAHEPLPDGRSNLIVRGMTRARIVSELAPERAYRLVRALPLPDQVRDAQALAGAFDLLNAITSEIARRLPSGGDTLAELARTQTSTGPLTDVLAQLLVTDPDDRQKLFETVDVAVRAEALVAYLGRVLAKLGKGGPAN